MLLRPASRNPADTMLLSPQQKEMHGPLAERGILPCPEATNLILGSISDSSRRGVLKNLRRLAAYLCAGTG